MRGISSLVEDLLASQEEVSSMESLSQLVSQYSNAWGRVQAAIDRFYIFWQHQELVRNVKNVVQDNLFVKSCPRCTFIFFCFTFIITCFVFLYSIRNAVCYSFSPCVQPLALSIIKRWYIYPRKENIPQIETWLLLSDVICLDILIMGWHSHTCW